MKIHTVIIGENKYEKYQKSFARQGVDLTIHQFQPEERYANFINPKRAQANIERLQIIYKYGGYYVDSDYYMIKPFPDLLQEYEHVFLKQASGNIINAFFGARRGSQIIQNIIDESNSLIEHTNQDEFVGSYLFNKHCLDIQNTIYVGKEYYTYSKGYLLHDSLRGRNY